MCNDYIMAIVSQEEGKESGSLNAQQSWNVKYEKAIAPLKDRIGTSNTKLVVGGTLVALSYGIARLLTGFFENKGHDKHQTDMTNQYNTNLHRLEQQQNRLKRTAEQIRRAGDAHLRSAEKHEWSRVSMPMPQNWYKTQKPEYSIIAKTPEVWPLIEKAQHLGFIDNAKGDRLWSGNSPSYLQLYIADEQRGIFGVIQFEDNWYFGEKEDPKVEKVSARIGNLDGSHRDQKEGEFAYTTSMNDLSRIEEWLYSNFGTGRLEDLFPVNKQDYNSNSYPLYEMPWSKAEYQNNYPWMQEELQEEVQEETAAQQQNPYEYMVRNLE